MPTAGLFRSRSYSKGPRSQDLGPLSFGQRRRGLSDEGRATRMRFCASGIPSSSDQLVDGLFFA